MNRDKLTQTRDAIDAALNGRPWEWFDATTDRWVDADAVTIEFALKDELLIRPKPIPTLRWWNCADDVPKVPVIWLQIAAEEHLVTAIASDGLHTADSFYLWTELENQKIPHSTDRQTWQPCKTEVLA
jgi:hypothetical protein